MSKNTPQEQKVLSAEDYINSVSKQRGDNLVISKKEAARHLELFAKQKMIAMWDEKSVGDEIEKVFIRRNPQNIDQSMWCALEVFRNIKSMIDGKE